MAWQRIKGQKYHNTKVVYDGIKFDSKKEARRYEELKTLEHLKIISNLQRQVRFELIPAQREPSTVGAKGGMIKGKLLERKVEYVADFVYEMDGNIVVEDTKGMKTPEYIIKRKLMLWRFDIRIKEI